MPVAIVTTMAEPRARLRVRLTVVGHVLGHRGRMLRVFRGRMRVGDVEHALDAHDQHGARNEMADPGTHRLYDTQASPAAPTREACVRDARCDGIAVERALTTLENGEPNPDYADFGRGTHPVAGVSWYDAQVVVGWLNAKARTIAGEIRGLRCMRAL